VAAAGGRLQRDIGNSSAEFIRYVTCLDEVADHTGTDENHKLGTINDITLLPEGRSNNGQISKKRDLSLAGFITLLNETA